MQFPAEEQPQNSKEAGHLFGDEQGEDNSGHTSSYTQSVFPLSIHPPFSQSRLGCHWSSTLEHYLFVGSLKATDYTLSSSCRLACKR
jgi:hypothetical protein